MIFEYIIILLYDELQRIDWKTHSDANSGRNVMTSWINKLISFDYHTFTHTRIFPHIQTHDLTVFPQFKYEINLKWLAFRRK